MKVTARISAAAVVCVAVTLSAHPALAAGGDGGPAAPLAGVRMDNGFYMYDSAARPASGTEILIQGSRVVGGCGFKGSVTLRPGAPAMEWDEVGYNPSTCQEIAVVGPASHRSTAASVAPTATGPSADSPAASYNLSGNLHSYYTDPVNATVTELFSIISWAYNYSCVTSGSGRTFAHGYFGWVQDGGNSPGNFLNCEADEEDAQAHFHNDVFPGCGGVRAYTDYWYNRIYGHYDGSLTADWYSTKSGGGLNCINALVEHHVATFGTGGH